ncbi:hypothetical protein CANINC_000347 [Pichia inconspicua]|uniref:NmrA-like domain-containing protein n=1 Tax=Pichia inconspicua TaxID=52247 RepID=A0A4T0X6W8_9ASCO|nr:hypothetical protein CANINC_000347 [[Candida] inconspicua]
MSIAITGATGQLGQLVIQTLLKSQSPKNIVGLVRNLEKAQNLKDQGIEVRLFDYDKPETLVPALKGVERLLLISSNNIGNRVPQHKQVVDAAKEAGVTFLAYTSLLFADKSKLSLADEHLQTENYIKQSGLDWSFLRNGWYIENYLGAVQNVIQTGTLYGSAKDAKISGASRQDFAEAAAKVLTTDGHNGKIYELAGSESFTLSDLAKAISDVSGKEVKYQDIPPADYTAALLSHGLPEGLVKVIVEADEYAIDGALYDDSKTLEKLIGHPSTPLKEAVEQAINA